MREKRTLSSPNHPGFESRNKIFILKQINHKSKYFSSFILRINIIFKKIDITYDFELHLVIKKSSKDISPFFEIFYLKKNSFHSTLISFIFKVKAAFSYWASKHFSNFKSGHYLGKWAESFSKAQKQLDLYSANKIYSIFFIFLYSWKRIIKIFNCNNWKFVQEWKKRKNVNLLEICLKK